MAVQRTCPGARAVHNAYLGVCSRCGLVGFLHEAHGFPCLLHLSLDIGHCGLRVRDKVKPDATASDGESLQSITERVSGPGGEV